MKILDHWFPILQLLLIFFLEIVNTEKIGLEESPYLKREVPERFLSYHPQVRRLQAIIYEENLKQIDEHNKLQNKTYKQGPNAFSVLTEQEIQAQILTLIPSEKASIEWAQYISGGESIVGNTLDSTNTDLTAQPQISESYNTVIKLLRQHLEKQNLPEQQIQQTIQKYAIADPNVTGVLPGSSNRRNLQIFRQNIDYNVDWSCVAGPVKNQGLVCGSCYAFATADVFSMLMSIYGYGFTVSYSVQDIISCSQHSLTLGCAGGFLQGAFVYMKKIGLILQKWYPYSDETFSKGIQGDCLPNKNKKRYKIQRFQSNFGLKTSQKCIKLKQFLLKQPVAVGLVGKPLLNYQQGILNDCKNSIRIDHAVVIVGYNQNKGWHFKNSWGVEWGERGFGWIAHDNTCFKICDMAMIVQPDQQNAFVNYHLEEKPLRKCN